MTVLNDRLNLDELPFYDIKAFHRAGYLLVPNHPDEAAVQFDTLAQIATQAPADGATIAREFGGKTTLVATGTGDSWEFETNQRMIGIGRFTLGPDQHIPSLNAEYIPTAHRGRAGKTLSAWGRKYKEILQDQAQYSDLPGFFDRMRELGWTRTHQHYRVHFEFYYTYLHNKRDCTNMIKLTEDALADVVGNNDSRNKSVSVSEFESPDEFEHVHVMYELINIG